MCSTRALARNSLASMNPVLRAQLAPWMSSQRWYGGKGGVPEPDVVATWELPTDDASAVVRVFIVADRSVTPAAIYQVPVVERHRDSRPIDPSHVIAADDGITVVDGPHDPAYAQALLMLIIGPSPEPSAAEVLVGEQSNSSIIFRPARQHPIIVKVFRRLHPGVNPDIELQTALSATGTAHVPRTLGALEGTWRDDEGNEVRGFLAFGQEFLPDVADAWRVALHAARADERFDADALGEATALVHLALGRLFPTGATTAADRATTRAAWDRRLRIAESEVPQLAPLHDRIEQVYDAALATEWPDRQRIHGDLHLGQALLAPDRGWVLLDFEGEPMRPMSERVRPDLAVRDVAGMLRSFDYVAGALAQEAPAVDGAQAWSERARASFIEGYEATAGEDVRGPLLDALELDKAVYEAIYEARNRPTWLPIPLAAIDRLVSAERPAVTDR